MPQHLLVGPETHGVTRYAAELAAAAGATVVRDTSAVETGAAVHLHLTDRLLGREPADAAVAVEDLARRVLLTVTLHDVPQPTDGPGFRARAEAYGRIIRASTAWATNSWHEHALVERWSAAGATGMVIPLPVDARGDITRSGTAGVVESRRGDGVGRPVPEPVIRPPAEPVLGVFGFVYPGKGQQQVLRAAAALRRAGTVVGVRVLGAAAPGHAEELEALVRNARARGVPLEVTGRVPDRDLASALRGVTVPVCAHRNVSASGSLNSWIAAGRRPLVRDGAYAREMEQLRPGTTTLFDDATLVPRLHDALKHPGTTWTGSGVDLRPLLTDTAATYRAWWATVRR